MFKLQITTTPETKKFLKQFPIEFRKTLFESFRKAMYFLEGQVKKSFGASNTPKVRSGALRRSINVNITERQNIIAGIIGSDLVYAPVQEFGAVIKPKNKPFMRFMIGERWVTLKQVIIPARPYLFPTVNDNIDEINNMIEKDLAEVANNVK